jgi:enterochelin esterase-like enzyme
MTSRSRPFLAGLATGALTTVALAAPLESPRLEALRQTLSAPGAAAEFWAGVKVRSAPLVEPAPDGSALVTFLWRGESNREVELGWPVWTADRRDNHLQRLGDSDVWFKTVRLPAGTRLSYQLAADPRRGAPGDRAAYRAGLVAALAPDPLNQHRWERSSVVELPGAPPQPWVAPRAVAKGRLATSVFESETLGNRREVTVYSPPGAAKATPLIIVFDADRYLSSIPTPTILDNLIAAGAIPPVTAVFVANPTRESRGVELACNPAFADMLTYELLPWIRARASVSDDPDKIVLAGSSFGGLISACAALRHPERFGAVLSQSGSFWWEPDNGKTPPDAAGWVARQVQAQDRKPIRFYLDAGLLEANGGSESILSTTRKLADVLRAKGYEVRQVEFAGGHDDLAWRGTLSDGLIHLLGDAR